MFNRTLSSLPNVFYSNKTATCENKFAVCIAYYVSRRDQAEKRGRASAAYLGLATKYYYQIEPSTYNYVVVRLTPKRSHQKQKFNRVALGPRLDSVKTIMQEQNMLATRTQEC